MATFLPLVLNIFIQVLYIVLLAEIDHTRPAEGARPPSAACHPIRPIHLLCLRCVYQ